MRLKTLFLATLIVSGNAFADMAADLDDHFRIYMIKPEKRSPGDRVTVNGDTANILYWESLKTRKPEEAICDAYEWLLLGRTSYGLGAKEAFDKYGSLNQINMTFYEIDFSTKKGARRAEILPSQNVFEYISIGVRRDSLNRKNFDRKTVKQMLAEHKCAEVGKTFIDTVSINENYLKSRK